MKYNHRYIKDGIGAYIHLRSFFKALLIRYGVKILVKVKNEDIIFSRIPFLQSLQTKMQRDLLLNIIQKYYMKTSRNNFLLAVMPGNYLAIILFGKKFCL